MNIYTQLSTHSKDILFFKWKNKRFKLFMNQLIILIVY
jgi:hypothetical protein